MFSGKWPRANSLFWRFAGWMTAGGALLLVATAAAMYAAMVAEIASIDEQVLIKRARNAADVLQTSSAIETWLGHEVSEDLESPRRVFLRVLSPTGEIVAETPSMTAIVDADAFPAPTPSDRDVTAQLLRGRQGHDLRVVSIQAPAEGFGPGQVATIQAAVDISVDEALLARYRGVMFLALAPLLVICALFSAGVAAHLIEPMRRVARESDGIGGDGEGMRLTATEGADEIRQLAGAFNAVLARLEQAHEKLRSYADTVAHEIRTPLNRMLIQAEIALRGERSVDEYREVLEQQLQECNELNHLAQRLLFLARAGHRVPQAERLVLAEEFAVLRDFYAESATEAGVALVASTSSPLISINAERALFQRALGNLVANALAHTPRGGQVEIRARVAAGGTLEMEIADTGCGISPEQLPRVFDRLYSGDASSLDSPRAGLGLAIVKSIVEMHGGVIRIESAIGQGTTVRVTWPSGPSDACAA